ncbi:MAG: hypothetical protein A2527_14305 [Candidatus Lambdaproteobacteria bacterium RIFOXYD2_FULL_50_16]|uniref:NmrA-like domain-containing protein n=1 Tax=Candidatus Lambdaproteobacteria bacterium RIFOXYD2_FULL_50_16 TaxID=1817772 RepID=A0A1F6G4Q7_9PROT|nr:MAG: hypothetical protein A2527_14305 [Candidatus Lambdaproteobacteria bacterium RIFOXYD2_FULL_50_16]
MKKTLVTGATGPLGRAALEKLSTLIPKNKLVALARQPEKLSDVSSRGIEVRRGDYSDVSSLEVAFSGIEQIYFVSGNDWAHRDQQHLNLIEAAKKAGVSHIAYTSITRQTESADSPLAPVAHTHLLTEKALRESGIGYSFLRHNLYLEVLSIFLGPDVLHSRQIFLPAGAGKVAFASRADLAEAGAVHLASCPTESGAYDFSNCASWSFEDLAKILSQLQGSPFQYSSPTAEVYQQTLASFGVPAEAIGMGVVFGGAIAAGELDKPVQTLNQLLGRTPYSLEDYLRKAYT